MKRRGRLAARVGDYDAVVESVLADAVEVPGLSIECFGDAVPATARWCRHARGGADATAWPSTESAEAVALRLPRDRASLAFALEVAASRLDSGAPIWIAGTNTEGARSIAKHVDPWFEAPETVSTRRHCRVVHARRIATDDRPRATLDEWRQTIEVTLPTGPCTLTSFPGLFSKGRLDDGTAMLLGALEPPPSGHALDFGCGAGPIGAFLARHAPALALDLIDIDALAIEAARLNVPTANVRLGDGWGAVDDGRDPRQPARRYDLIVSNPPIHRGRSEDFGVLEALVTGLRSHLRDGGVYYIVIQRQVPLERWLDASAKIVAEDGRFRVWRGVLR